MSPLKRVLWCILVDKSFCLHTILQKHIVSWRSNKDVVLKDEFHCSYRHISVFLDTLPPPVHQWKG